LYKKELHQTTVTELKEVREQAFERYSSSAHAKLKEDLKNDFAKGHDNYPTNRQEGLRLLNMFTKQDTCKPTLIFEGTSFGTVSEAQSYDIEYWMNKTCRCCGKKGHPDWIHTPEEQVKYRKAQQEKKRKKIKKESKESDDQSVGSARSKKSSKSTANKKDSLDEAAKAFATAMVENMGILKEEDSDSYSYDSH
jgi:hypothetical protein